MISATVIQDSVSATGVRLTTIEYTAPRFILAEFNTHRVFSRNAGSSRAIPTTRLIERVTNTPVIPVWNRNKSGMQGQFDVTDEEIATWQQIWLEARDDAVKHATRLAEAKCHKQIVNRVIEPYMFYKGLVTSTEWDNWFKLRGDEATAQPEIFLLSNVFQEAFDNSTPRPLTGDDWHIPYIMDDEQSLDLQTKLKISVARCARLSYKTFDDDRMSEVDKDTILYQQLYEGGHYSPFEHQACPDPMILEPNLWGNFNGWCQYRKMLEI